MTFEELLAQVDQDDLRWMVPIVAGFLIVLAGFIAGIARGMVPGVLVSFFFGGLLVVSPVLLDTIERPLTSAGAEGGAVEAAGIEVATSGAALAIVNAERLTELTRVMATLRRALESARPLLPEPVAGEGREAASLFADGLEDAEGRLDGVIDGLDAAAAAAAETSAALDNLTEELRVAAETAGTPSE